MMNKLTELVEALIPLVKEATIRLRHQNQTGLTAAVAEATEAPAKVVAEENIKAFKEKKEKKAAQAPSETSALSVEEGQARAFSLAKEVAQKFQKATPDGMTRLRSLLNTAYEGVAIAKLTHEARLSLIVELKKLLQEKA